MIKKYCHETHYPVKDCDVPYPDEVYVSATVAEKMYDLLKKLLESGDWYQSALEIDIYNDYCGEELESEIKAVLKLAEEYKGD